jgi:hypothetical protein
MNISFSCVFFSCSGDQFLVFHHVWTVTVRRFSSFFFQSFCGKRQRGRLAKWFSTNYVVFMPCLIFGGFVFLDIYIYIFFLPAKRRSKSLVQTRLCRRWKRCVKLAVKERERVREMDFFFYKKSDWEATVLPNVLGTLGSTVASQLKHVNIGCLLWGSFCEFW